MTSAKTEAESLPALVTLSSALALGEITAREYNGAQRVAAMEDSVKKPFYQEIWGNVLPGDVVLKAWESTGEIVEIKIELCAVGYDLDGSPRVLADFELYGDFYSYVFNPDETVYVQSRL